MAIDKLFLGDESLKIALAQINPTIGDFDGNSQKIFERVRQAESLGADIVVFSELVLCGYPPKDLLDKPDFIEKSEKALQELISKIQGPGVVLGCLETIHKVSGKGLTNSAVFFKNGKVLIRSDKILLPTYDVFDELRYFEPGEKPVVCDFFGKKIGLTVCEDIWCLPGFNSQIRYAQNPVEELIHMGAEVIFNISASPYEVLRWKTRHSLAQALSTKYKVPIVLVNQVGGNDDLLFDGHSFVVSSEGKIVAQAQGFVEDLLICDLENFSGKIEVAPESEEEEIFKALSMGVRDYLNKCGYQRAVIGLSGGIDSAVVAVIAAKALGKENVEGLSMPSQYTASQSIQDARRLADNLGIKFSVIPIKELFDGYKNCLKPVFGERPEDVTEENIQARIRGNLLMAVSNKLGSMVLSTGNKSEMSVGYCTLYGDMAGGLSVISDLPKTKVYKLAQWINKEDEIIPKAILERPPTAELRPNQKDQDSLPPYEILDSILEGYVENHLSMNELMEKGFDSKLLKEIITRVDNNEYKRQQAAPGLKITGKAFGSGRRFPIAKRYKP